MFWLPPLSIFRSSSQPTQSPEPGATPLEKDKLPAPVQGVIDRLHRQYNSARMCGYYRVDTNGCFVRPANRSENLRTYIVRGSISKSTLRGSFAAEEDIRIEIDTLGNQVLEERLEHSQGSNRRTYHPVPPQIDVPKTIAKAMCRDDIVVTVREACLLREVHTLRKSGSFEDLTVVGLVTFSEPVPYIPPSYVPDPTISTSKRQASSARFSIYIKDGRPNDVSLVYLADDL